ncbi:hypothetical protein BHM03_00049561 [Ensete ventricosum]|nr:hypothetical protein BHM03_00049561 [Ensete ventricosum]
MEFLLFRGKYANVSQLLELEWTNPSLLYLGLCSFSETLNSLVLSLICHFALQFFSGDKKTRCCAHLSEYVTYVIDSGFVKQRQYNPSTGMYSLDIVQISRLVVSRYFVLVLTVFMFLSKRCVKNKLPIVSAGESLEDALRQLYLIDAIDENGEITEIGKAMAGKSSIQNIHA